MLYQVKEVENCVWFVTDNFDLWKSMSMLLIKHYGLALETEVELLPRKPIYHIAVSPFNNGVYNHDHVMNQIKFFAESFINYNGGENISVKREYKKNIINVINKSILNRAYGMPGRRPGRINLR